MVITSIISLPFVIAIRLIVMFYSIIKGWFNPEHKAKVEEAIKLHEELKKQGYSDNFIDSEIQRKFGK